MSGASLELVLGLERMPALVVWDRLYSSHRRFLDGVREVKLDGRECMARDVARGIERSRQRHFGVIWNGCTLDYSHVANSDLSFVSAEGCVRDEEDAERWLVPFVGGDEFRQARLYDADYEFWQNAADPLQYRARGRSYEGLPMRPNGLPPPLDQMVIDISRNPGRRVLRRGFVEAVGCPMWLGESFWRITGASREVVCAEDWLRCETWCGSVVRLRPEGAPFETGEGRLGAVQERLRNLLYATHPG